MKQLTLTCIFIILAIILVGSINLVFAQPLVITLDKTIESWMGEFNIYANFSGGTTEGWNANATIITPTANYFVNLSNVGNGIYTNKYIIDNNTGYADNKLGTWNISVSASNDSYSLSNSTNISIIAVRRSFPPSSVNITRNNDGTYQHKITGIFISPQSSANNLIVKFKLLNQNLTNVAITSSYVNWFEVRNNNTIVLSMNLSTDRSVAITFNASTDLGVFHLDKYSTAHISARTGYNGLYIWNSKQAVAIMPYGSKSPGKAFDFSYVQNGVFWSTYCVERSGIAVDNSGWTQGSNNEYSMGWNSSIFYLNLSLTNSTNIVLDMSNGNLTEWGNTPNTTVTRRLTFYPNSSYSRQDWSVYNTDTKNHTYSLVYGVEPWIEPGGNTVSGDRGIIPNNSTEILPNVTITNGTGWVGWYDNSSFYSGAYIFFGNNALLSPSNIYFVKNAIITAFGLNYPANPGVSDINLGSAFFEKSFGNVSSLSNPLTFSFYVWSGKGTNHTDIGTQIESVFASVRLDSDSEISSGYLGEVYWEASSDVLNITGNDYILFNNTASSSRNISLYNLTSALLTNGTSLCNGSSSNIALNTGNVNTTLQQNQFCYVLDSFNCSESLQSSNGYGCGRQYSPLAITKKTSSSLHITNTISILNGVSITFELPNCANAGMITYTSDSGIKQTFNKNQFTCQGNLVTITLNNIEKSSTSNELEWTYGCSQFEQTGYRIILIAGSLLILGIFFFLWKKDYLSELSVGQIVMIVIAILVGIALFTGSANIIGGTCQT